MHIHLSDGRPQRTHTLCCAALVLMAALHPGQADADEGMWRPNALKERKKALAKAGLKLPVAELADLRRGPLAAVINLNGCSASFVSAEGLLVTNHHCAVGAIQHNSTAKDNLLETGFTAASQARERWAGASAHVLVTVEERDVTDECEEALRDARDEMGRFVALDATHKRLVARCELTAGTRCRVASYDGGARYVLIRQLDIRDVRLVHAPPRSIGVFGGDIDNWMWPRHTGDWSLFRAYVGKDGKPADHHKDNVPFKPARWLSVAPQGIQPGAFVMVAGYPGRTHRHRLPTELAHRVNVELPYITKMIADLVTLLEREQRKSAAAKVKLTSLRAGLANYHKYNLGLIDGLRGKTDVPLARFAQFKSALQANGQRAKIELLDRMERRLSQMRARGLRADLLRWMLRLPALSRVGSTVHWRALQRRRPDAERDAGYQARDEKRLKAGLQRALARYVPSAEEALWEYLLLRSLKLPATARIEAIDALMTKAARRSDRGSVLWRRAEGAAVRMDTVKRVARSLAKCEALTRPRRLEALLREDHRYFQRQAKEPLTKLMLALAPLREAAVNQQKRDAGFMSTHRPAYAALLRGATAEAYYPDANSTLRVTFGHVRGYRPRESVDYAPQTTLHGILEKASDKPPFDLSKEQREAIEKTHTAMAAGTYRKAWADARLKSVPVNFLSTCDTTGGNSGSPTLDAQGRLVGLLFDGNYESMSSDWLFDKAVTRSIHVDIRYLLWALDELHHGQWLLRELGVSPRP